MPLGAAYLCWGQLQGESEKRDPPSFSASTQVRGGEQVQKPLEKR